MASGARAAFNLGRTMKGTNPLRPSRAVSLTKYRPLAHEPILIRIRRGHGESTQERVRGLVTGLPWKRERPGPDMKTWNVRLRVRAHTRSRALVFGPKLRRAKAAATSPAETGLAVRSSCRVARPG
jgi:hypothetical protein